MAQMYKSMPLLTNDNNACVPPILRTHRGAVKEKNEQAHVTINALLLGYPSGKRSLFCIGETEGTLTRSISAA